VSRSGEIVRQWGDAERTFRLGIGEWRKIQETCDAGPAEIAARLAKWAAMRQRAPAVGFLDLLAAGGLGNWRVDDVREPLYRGLIGGGMSPTAAGFLMRDLFDERPLTENVALALEIVLASLVGPEDEPVGEQDGEAQANGTRFPEASSGSPISTAPVQ
jgi:hypothetical protein